MSLTTRASGRENGKCLGCGQFLPNDRLHFHTPRAERVRRVWTIGEWGDGYLARGTLDTEVAKAAVVRHILRTEEYGEIEVHQMVSTMKAEPGLYRCNPCSCGEGHQFDMGTADRPGPGTFRGVYFRS